MADKGDETGTDASRSDEKVADEVRKDLVKKAEKAIADRDEKPRSE